MEEIERLRKKLESYPSPSAYSRLAELMRLNGNLDEAAELCQRCIHEFPRNGQAYVILAGVHLSRGNKQIAKDTLLTGTQQDRRSYSGLRMLSDLQAEDGQLNEAIISLRAILEFKPQDKSVQQRIDDLSKAAAAAPGSATTASGRQRVVKGDTRDAGTDTIDLTASSVSLTSTAVPGAAPAPAAAAIPTATPVIPTSSGALAPLCAEQGVIGAIVVDAAGRVVISEQLDAEADLLAALSLDVTTTSCEALGAVGSQEMTSWAIATGRSQILAYRRDENLSLIVKADANCKLALLELRARQALIDLGAQG